MTAAVAPLTESGMGAVLDADDDLAALGARVREAALEHGCVLVRGLDLDEPHFQSLVHAIGSLVEHKFGEGKADLLKLDASREPGKVVTGRGMLPLHTDGLFPGVQTDLIILYARQFGDEPGSGETFVCDQLSAWAQMPERLRGVLDKAGRLEYLVTERGYFPNVPEDWYPIDVVRDYGRVRSLNLALGFDADEAARGWQVRVPEFAPEESDAYLAELNAYLTGPRYTYQHRWTEGDLLVIDNQRTLHGRTAIGEGGVRVLFRGQIRL
jgi:alpha-ketoglutarate-dependent taurine dioxygenase